MAGTLEVRLLGAFDIRCGDKAIEIASRAAQSLFAYLILNAGTAYRREKLAGQLWPESTEESARDYLRHALWRIRKALQAASSASLLHADDLVVSFEAAGGYWLDAGALLQLNTASSEHDLAEALHTYAGELLPGFYDEWVVLEREHLQAAYEQNINRLLARLQKQGRWSEIVQWAEKWIALGNRPEAPFRYLMTAHTALGDMAMAAIAFERCARSLAEFGVEPSPQTRQLYEDIRAGRQPDASRPVVGPPGARQTPPASNLPAPLTSFVGREKELAEIARMLKSQRLMTLLGPGGVGKTRLAIEAAHRLVSKFRDGIIWVELAGLSDPSLVPEAVRQASGAHEPIGRHPTEALVEHFSRRKSLLVLDNCEHLITACAHLAARLLSGCRELHILTTSREALDILGETTWTVPSLALPSAELGHAVKSVAGYESVRLFIERAQTVQPQFKLTDRNAAAAVQICHRLSGIPLAIELAAARLRMLSPDEIATRLNESFDLLSAGNRGALPRHQTLRATIDWSYELLSADEQVLLRRLSLFAGGFTLEAAEEVAPDADLERAWIVELLGQLINKSLVSSQPASESQTRYRMLETIREYAAEKLARAGETPALRERHLAYYAGLAKRAGGGMNTAQQVLWWHRAADDVENLRLALAWPDAALPQESGKLHSILRQQFEIIGSMAQFWEDGYRTETSQSLRRLLEMDRTNPPSPERGRALAGGGFVVWSLHRFEDATAYLEESIAIADRFGDISTLVQALSMQGWNYDFQGAYEKAKEYGTRSLEVAKGAGDESRAWVGTSLAYLGDIPYRQGNLGEARQYYEESARFMRELGEVNRLTYPVRRLGYVELQEGKLMQAAANFSESLALNRQIGHVQGMVACVAALGAVHLSRADVERAAILFGYVESFLRRAGAPFFFIDTLEYEAWAAQVERTLNTDALIRARRKGADLTLDEAIEIARAVDGTVRTRSTGKKTRSGKEAKHTLKTREKKRSGTVAA